MIDQPHVLAVPILVTSCPLPYYERLMTSQTLLRVL
jgi:hypothetical protein